MELDRWIDKLIGYAQARLFLNQRNVIYTRNTLLWILGKESYAASGAQYEGESAAELLGGLLEEGVRSGLFLYEDGERIADAVMGALTLSPKETESAFRTKLRASASRATEWLYELSVRSDYVKKDKLDQNPRFTAENGLIVTINLAKPEFRDPKKAASGNSTKGGYPSCTICRENEGFSGRSKRTLRTVSLKLGGEDWFWQFSPYGYFYQHGIAVNERHIPMHVDKQTFLKLMDFVDQFPHYFIGCNAPLPRIGGSVLAHDHFQGGGERLPIFSAGAAVSLRNRSFPETEICVLDWFGTAVRVTGQNRDVVAALSDLIREGWVHYEDRSRGLIPEDEAGVHHAVSPTVVKTQNGYEMTLILRSNITSEQYPDGVFHAHPEFHVIKKESIGLIEAQGLFILPGRLSQQLERVKEVLVSGGELPEELRDFEMIFSELKAGGEKFTEEEAQAAIRRELGSVCERILKNTAVFASHNETADFLKGLGFYET